MNKGLWWAAAAMLVLVPHPSAPAKESKSIISSKHNLTVTGPGSVKAALGQDVCNFCHTPHMEQQGFAMWDMKAPRSYITYKSSTIKAAVGQPTGSSRLCLSCHDGTIALGAAQDSKLSKLFSGGASRLRRPANLGIDLSDDHPISFEYDSSLAARSGELEHPAMLKAGVQLDENSQVQCTTCHSPHDDRYGKFLVMDNKYSQLCTACHRLSYWSMSSHKISNATWRGGGASPWPHTAYTTVAANGCENCHRPHTAGGREWLLNFDAAEDNCYACHNGSVAATNIRKEFEKPFRHPIEAARRVHKPDEDPLWMKRHVTCNDCHNPHAANAVKAVAPVASGSLAQVAGVSSSGSSLKRSNFEYELCYRCHADNPGTKKPMVTRQIFEKNLRLKFRPSNASYHPVENVGRNSSVPSLIRPYTQSSRIYCTDCHNGNSGSKFGGTGPNGPHGSIWEPILEQQLMINDFTAESVQSYAMCYKCHNRNSILSNQSFPEHSRHVVEQKAPCTACHDSHGVRENKHLINFDKTIVAPNQQGAIAYESRGNRTGSCSLFCHNQEHDRRVYPKQAGQSMAPLQPGSQSGRGGQISPQGFPRRPMNRLPGVSPRIYRNGRSAQ